ncbi:hypothetical protein C8J57DRAFT_1237114 [Mycena rebaudengoi]|nr:hypothetical protein C8J57DRAFT_1241873 [Mycena rebaudengoi]KAJ7253864.1 hypothetical protein C8J57DRAFT_1237114 [Mycena rebaudengoi]
MYDVHAINKYHQCRGAAADVLRTHPSLATKHAPQATEKRHVDKRKREIEATAASHMRSKCSTTQNDIDGINQWMARPTSWCFAYIVRKYTSAYCAPHVACPRTGKNPTCEEEAQTPGVVVISMCTSPPSVFRPHHPPPVLLSSRTTISTHGSMPDGKRETMDAIKRRTTRTKVARSPSALHMQKCGQKKIPRKEYGHGKVLSTARSARVNFRTTPSANLGARNSRARSRASAYARTKWGSAPPPDVHREAHSSAKWKRKKERRELKTAVWHTGNTAAAEARREENPASVRMSAPSGHDKYNAPVALRLWLRLRIGEGAGRMSDCNVEGIGERTSKKGEKHSSPLLKLEPDKVPSPSIRVTPSPEHDIRMRQFDGGWNGK